MTAGAPTPLPPPPPELAGLVRLVGAEAALTLVELHGGTRLPIPREANQGTRLAREIGLEAARALSAEHGGLMIKVPQVRRWRALVYRQRDGLTYAAIARRLSTTEGRVWEWLNAARMTTPQPDLFA